MKRRSISITDETWLRIKLLAVGAGKTPSQLVEEACKHVIEHYQSKGPIDEPQGRKP